MKEVRAQQDVGVIVGRFQVPELHRAHKELIQHVCDQHDKVIIFLGLSPLMNTRNNPLDFESRKQMILEQFPDVNVLYIKDLGSDEFWSKKLDEQIIDLVTPGQTVVLYGGRDSFIKHYEPYGKFATRELEQDYWVSGNEIRKAVATKRAKPTADFRAGAVWAAYSRFPTTYACVDIAIFNTDYDRILLGRKTHEREWRLIGGFADPSSDSFEDDAIREVREETGIEVRRPEYVKSFNIDDWRYRGEVDGIRTMLFTTVHISGDPQPDDDIAELRWFEVAKLKPNQVVANHVPLVYAALCAASTTKFPFTDREES